MNLRIEKHYSYDDYAARAAKCSVFSPKTTTPIALFFLIIGAILILMNLGKEEQANFTIGVIVALFGLFEFFVPWGYRMIAGRAGADRGSGVTFRYHFKGSGVTIEREKGAQVTTLKMDYAKFDRYALDSDHLYLMEGTSTTFFPVCLTSLTSAERDDLIKTVTAYAAKRKI